MDKKAHSKQKPRKMICDPPNAGQITEMPIRTGLILSQDLGVRRNMLTVLTGVRYLQTSLENVLRQGDPECGWLLENSFVETARSNFNIIKHLGKFNQINKASNGDPNIDKPPTAHYGPDNVPPKPLSTAS